MTLNFLGALERNVKICVKMFCEFFPLKAHSSLIQMVCGLWYFFISCANSIDGEGKEVHNLNNCLY